MEKHKFRLHELWRSQAEKWLLAWALGAATLLATVALLAVSGWFISAAAAAGLAAMATAYTFDYFRPGAIIRALAIIRTAGRYGERLASHNAVLALLRDLRICLFANLTHAWDKANVSAQIMHRLTGDIDLLDNLPLRFFMPWLWALLLQTAFLLWLAFVAPSLAIAVALPLLLAGIVLPALAAVHGKKLAREDADQAETRRTLLLEPLQMLTSLLLWRRWADCRREFIAADEAYGQLKRRQQALASLYGWLQQCLLAVVVGLMIWQALPLLQAQDLSVPVLLAMVLAVFGLNEVLSPLTAQFMAYGFAAAARDRLNELTMPSETVFDIQNHDLQTALNDISHISVQNLYARYTGALNGAEKVSFTLTTGEALIIRGKSGCGKSTLLDVLAGELAAQSGRLNMSGREYDFAAVNYLAQQVDIFDMSLADNLRLGDDKISDEDLWRVLAQVALADWARAQPQGLQTPLGEYGAAVSGGQARRIALARLLLRPKPVLLLDEPFAGLDEATRGQIWQTLREAQADGFLIAASHHLPKDSDDQILEINS
ncbi:thiol reductant ABC exporter subunit CydC [Neisseria sp. N95_16]|uniref:Thiol reductant ABC exporter subunit CydC n=1 Tax=Neisseria brasiliensis TaxID=2666100 RepID=A0A7X2KZ23_9NEIS|nr:MULTISPECIES: thiol reductant ABC exporter subunit CydC [Neisseria]MRN39241.1 thiol reductant ABC exporter subunit CydC [Neisseria brasiliensis]PJO09833.1 thiol reductant ABC exporter subunit CydC [Neisseria sp. N95_16]